MGKAQAAAGNSGKDQDDSVTNDGPPAPGLWPRMTESLRARCAGQVDSSIARLGRLRLRLVPVASEGDEADKAPEPIVIIKKAPGHRRRFLVGVMMLLIGAGAGALFSFNLFEQRIESQGEKILDQADDLFQQQKDASRAERLLRETKDELKDTRLGLETIKTESDQIRMRMIEAEGRINMYGNKALASAGGNVGRASDLAARPMPRQAQSAEMSGSCDLLSKDATHDLSKCLEHLNH